jgi:KDO2-lipid IV(A) lauroyltransferase
VIKITGLLPWRGVQLSGKFLGQLGYFLSRRYRKITLNNLKLAFGNRRNQTELIAIARETYINLGKGLSEGAGFIRFSHREMRELIRLEGKENLEAALGNGKGVIGFSAHLGNFGLLGARLAAEGYPFSLVLRDPEVEQIAEIFHLYLGHHGVGVIPALPRKRATIELLKHLRRNEIVCIFGDQRELRAGVFVDFFSHPAGTATGPVVLAMRTGASILPMFSIREPDDKHVVIIEPVLELSSTGNREKDIYTNTARLTGIIENYVKRFPAQWFWLHQRWKMT